MISTILIVVIYTLLVPFKKNSKKELRKKSKYIFENFYHIIFIDMLLVVAIIYLVSKLYG